MRVQLLYFAALRELVGRDAETLALPPGVTNVGALSRWLEETRPALEGRLGSVRFAVDESFATNDVALHDGAVVALIPPVSGG